MLHWTKPAARPEVLPRWLPARIAWRSVWGDKMAFIVNPVTGVTVVVARPVVAAGTVQGIPQSGRVGIFSGISLAQIHKSG